MSKKIREGVALGVLLSYVLYGGVNVHAQETPAHESVEETDSSVSYKTKDIEVVNSKIRLAMLSRNSPTTARAAT